jgi:hypothetical protein
MILKVKYCGKNGGKFHMGLNKTKTVGIVLLRAVSHMGLNRTKTV